MIRYVSLEVGFSLWGDLRLRVDVLRL